MQLTDYYFCETCSDNLKSFGHQGLSHQNKSHSISLFQLKKIFLQRIDFSWRSHLQYLEQLRQVIVLRQYAQKDPLSEFKKEAFVLFEGLLAKIKNDLIKFLFNLNIVISDEEEKKEITEDKKFNKKGKKKRW